MIDEVSSEWELSEAIDSGGEWWSKQGSLKAMRSLVLVVWCGQVWYEVSAAAAGSVSVYLPLICR